ncbi:hypothetical protein [Nostoc sphaeroides]|uniref:Uncharacterized protein n=1 Tax=Nostoc sphaeroides CCNUC1 TaxID=2653204 RepID=A0A5P8WGI3_9NOSO|nr:hypothetical protein [Nostoc sphaeroides]QFS51947.1 hypothetical protein GXM_09441 [Nostoc sphaeroides CCNUC1]
MNLFKFFRMYWNDTNLWHTAIAPTVGVFYGGSSPPVLYTPGAFC